MLAVTPGPNMVYVMSRSIAQVAPRLISLGGVMIGYLFYMFGAAFGITTLFMSVPYAGSGWPWLCGVPVVSRVAGRQARRPLAVRGAGVAQRAPASFAGDGRDDQRAEPEARDAVHFAAAAIHRLPERQRARAIAVPRFAADHRVRLRERAGGDLFEQHRDVPARAPDPAARAAGR